MDTVLGPYLNGAANRVAVRGDEVDRRKGFQNSYDVRRPCGWGQLVEQSCGKLREHLRRNNDVTRKRLYDKILGYALFAKIANVIGIN